VSDPIVGIDLGTSNSVVAHADATGSVRVLADDAGYKIHPSVVSFHPNGGVVVGAAAKQRKVIDPQNTIYSIKRLIGRSFRSVEVQTAMKRSPFTIKEGPNHAPLIVTRGGEFAVPEVSAIVLDHVRNLASARLETPISRAVVTVPASFNDAQRSATATAGAIAGLTVVRVLNEPTAAALAYGHTRHLREIIAVYDFGGGTFDITFLKLEDQVYEVLGTSGDTFLGGDDLDERLVEKMVAKFLAENRLDLRTNEVAMMRLRAVAEQTKIELSRRSRAVVRIDEIAYGPRGAPLNLQIEISRDEFVRDVSDLIDRTFPVCTEALALAQLSVDQIADVILVGGSTKIPYVRDQVTKFFGKPARTDVNPEDAVAAGAALQAMSLERILSRRPSSRLAISAPSEPAAPAGPGDETTGSFTDVAEMPDPESGATMAPSELTLAVRDRPKRPTASYDSRRPGSEMTKPDTSYSVTRAGVRDAVADAERYPGAPARTTTAVTAVSRPSPPVTFEERTPTPFTQTQPLGRITRPVTAVSPATPPPLPPPLPAGAQQKTLFGVPAGPTEIEVDLGSAGVLADARQPAAPGTAIPPPLPRNTQRAGAPARPVVQQTAPLPPVHRRPEPPEPSMQAAISGWLDAPEPPSWSPADSADGTNPAAWAIPHPATTQPMAPTTPIAPPTAPTLVAIAPDYAAATTRGLGAQTLLEPSPATTARGFQPPQTYPVQPAGPAAMPPMPPMPPSLPATQPLLPAMPMPPARPAMPMPPQPPWIAPAPPPPPPRPVLLEVTPRGLGIATVAGYCEELIRRNARVPTEARKLFTTSRDLQDLVRIVVCQGESRRLDNNTVIGDLVLQGIPPRPRGETSIEVTFSLDASGVLQVSARDAQTGTEQRATLNLVGDVAPEDVAASRDRLQQLRR
jgi:molecular chaperone DnaK